MSTGDAVGDGGEDGSKVHPNGASNVLVISDPMDEDARESYFESFLPDRPAEIDVLGIDYRRTSEEWLDEWRRRAGGTPRRCAIVTVDDLTRSAASTGGSAVAPGTVACVESPGDLTGIGIRFQQSLSEFGGPETVVTVDSLTALLQYVELDRAFRFLHVLTTRVKNVGAVAHYHMNPGAHDDRAVAMLRTLFDAVAEYDGDAWSLEHR